MSERRDPKVGDSVVFHDAHGKPQNALITCVWSSYMINIVFVSNDETKQDDYGRQIERRTSVAMLGHSPQMAHGNYCRFDDEEPIPYKDPAAT
jgi:hypothetical protein